MRVVFASLALALASGQGILLQKPAKDPRTIEAKQLTVTTSQSVTEATPRSTVSLFVDVFPREKMHVYAPEQKGGYIRIELALEDQPGVIVAKTVFPKASDYHFAPLNETFKVFAKPFRIRQDVTALRTPVTINGTLRYQACDDLVCYRPDQVKVSWKISRAE